MLKFDENKAVRFSKQLTLLAAPPKTEPPCIPLSKDLLVCRASSSHQNSPSIFLICRSRNITGTCPASTNGRPASASQAAPTTGLRCFLQTLVSWSLNLSLWRNLNLIILTPEDRGRGCIVSSRLTPKEDYVCQIKTNLGFDLLHMFRSFPSNCIHNGSHHIPLFASV